MSFFPGTHLTRRGALLLAVAASVMLAGCGAPGTPAEDDAWTPPALTDDVGELPEGREIIQGMADFMNSIQELAVEARVTYESVQESGQKLQFEMLQRIAMRKPDQIFWVTLRDDASEDTAWYDNGRFTMMRQPANVWGEIRVPGGIAGMVQELVTDYEILVPFPDILSGDPQDLWLGEDVTSVTYVGEAWVDGRWTDHVAIRKPGADIQIWVQKGDPFPAKFAIVFTEDESMPGYTARFNKWSIELPADPSLFQFTPPPGAERIDVVPVIER
jgi:hypothetical protein